MKLYLQMWSLKDEAEKDFLGTLKVVADMGYDGVEFAGYYDIPAHELRAHMDALGLETLATHVSYELLNEDLDHQIHILKTLGAKYIVCPWTDMDDTEKAKHYAHKLSMIGRKTAEEGLPLLYHNHSHEFHGNTGEKPIDIFYKTVHKGSVLQEPDVYWVQHSKTDLQAYLAANAKRMPVVHLKQMADGSSKRNVAADEGIIDFAAVMTMLPNAYFVYEQEETAHASMADDVRKSVEYIKGLFKKINH